MAGHLLKRRVERERTRMELVAADLSTARLVDYMQQYFNSAGTAAALYARTPDPTALDVIDDNLSALMVLVTELRSRKGDQAFVPEDPRLASLVEQFTRRQVKAVSGPLS